MPTGYTAPVQRGEVTDLPTFAMECARAFGALVMMRDEPMGVPIPDKFEPSPYHSEQLARANAEYAKASAMTLAEAEEGAAEDYARQVRESEERRSRRNQERARYEAMLAKVMAWTPPTPDHQGLKDFMAKQLAESIAWDCNDSYDPTPTRVSAEEWRMARIKSAIDSIAYASKSLAEETKRQEERTAWVRALRDSLK